MSHYFREPKSSAGRVKVELDLSNYASNADFKNATGVDTSTFAKKIDLANLKSDADNLDIDKLKNVPNNLSNLESKVDKLDVDKLVPAPVDLSKLSDAKIEDKISDITDLATTTSLNAKINEVKNKIPNITNLATTTVLTSVENKIPNVTNLVKNLIITQKLVKLKIKLLLIMIMINILLL